MQIKLFRKSLLALVFIFSIALLATSIYAEQEIMLTVRTVSASVKKQNFINEKLQDIKHKLKKLPFNHFDIRYATNVQVPVNEEKKINLSDGHILLLKVLYKEKKKIGLRVNWLDKAGLELLNTQMHFNSKEHMMAGVEQGAKQGLILTISVQ